jgi:hypothetical protein
MRATLSCGIDAEKSKCLASTSSSKELAVQCICRVVYIGHVRAEVQYNVVLAAVAVYSSCCY